MSSSIVWVQLYYKGKDEPEGQPTSVKKPKDAEESEWNIDAFKVAVKDKMAEELTHCSAATINVCHPETKPSSFSQDNAIRGDKILKALIDDLKNVSPPTSYDHPLIVVAPAPPQQQQQQQVDEQKNIKTSIFEVGVKEKLELAVFYFVDRKREPIGTGFFVGPRVAISAAHTFKKRSVEPVKVGAKRTGYFGKPHDGETCELVVSAIDWESDFIIFELQKEAKEATAYLEPALPSLGFGDEIILVAYQIGIHQDLPELGKQPSVGVFQGAITKAHDRHFVYSAPSFARDSGGAIILRGGQACGMHIMTVNQALELQELNSLDDNATTGESVQHVNSVEESVASLIDSLASGALGLSIFSVMAAHRSNQESKRSAS